MRVVARQISPPHHCVTAAHLTGESRDNEEPRIVVMRVRARQISPPHHCVTAAHLTGESRDNEEPRIVVMRVVPGKSAGDVTSWSCASAPGKSPGGGITWWSCAWCPSSLILADCV
jgi:uncharacterized MAPEG superfamily protein